MKKTLFPFISLFLIIFIIINLDFYKLLCFLENTSWKLLFLAFIFYILSFALRAFRWKLMINSVPFSRLFSVVAIHTLSNNIYPARTGEFSFLYLLKEFNKEKLLSMLFLARFMDIICIGIIFTLSVAFLAMNRVYWLLFPMTISVIVLLSLFLVILEKFIPEKGIFIKVKDFFLNTKEAFFSLKAYVFSVFIASFFIWIIKYIAFYFIALSVFKSFGIEVSFWQTVFGVSFSELTTVLPVHSIGGYGTFEAGWTGAYIILGFERKIAVTSGFIFHTLLLLFSIILGLPFLICYKFHE